MPFYRKDGMGITVRYILTCWRNKKKCSLIKFFNKKVAQFNDF